MSTMDILNTEIQENVEEIYQVQLESFTGPARSSPTSHTKAANKYLRYSHRPDNAAVCGISQFDEDPQSLLCGGVFGHGGHFTSD